jgi:hypothetical protein
MRRGQIQALVVSADRLWAWAATKAGIAGLPADRVNTS